MSCGGRHARRTAPIPRAGGARRRLNAAVRQHHGTGTNRPLSAQTTGTPNPETVMSACRESPPAHMVNSPPPQYSSQKTRWLDPVSERTAPAMPPLSGGDPPSVIRVTPSEIVTGTATLSAMVEESLSADPRDPKQVRHLAPVRSGMKSQFPSRIRASPTRFPGVGWPAGVACKTQLAMSRRLTRSDSRPIVFNPGSVERRGQVAAGARPRVRTPHGNARPPAASATYGPKSWPKHCHAAADHENSGRTPMPSGVAAATCSARPLRRAQCNRYAARIPISVATSWVLGIRT